MAPRKATTGSEAAPAGASEEAGFDQRLARLEEIVAELEGGDLALESAIARYRDGVALLQQCRTQLQAFRKQVEELSAEAEAALRPYEGDPDAGSEG
jgi:exodeoxyribonuclease VII small subunit